jgi:hypothetical protein
MSGACVVCSAVSLLSDDADNTANAGTVVHFNALATCGNGSPTYRFWMHAPGGSWQVVQDWSPSATLTWNTTGLVGGAYTFQVWARSAGSSQSYESFATTAFTLTGGVDFCAVATLQSSVPSPSSAGGNVTLTASAPDCNAEYKFWHLAPAGSWQIAQDWSPSATLNWNTANAVNGTHSFQVWVRHQGASVAYESFTSYDHQIVGSVVCTTVTSSFNPVSPGTTNGIVTVTANAACGGTPTYEFWMQVQGGTWTIGQPWGTSNTWVWDTTGFSAGSYNVQVWARGQGSTAAYDVFTPASSYQLVSANQECSDAGLQSNVTSPSQVGAPVTLTATSSTCPSPEYKFWRLVPNGSWQIVQDWSSSPTLAWDTSAAAPGAYSFQVWVRRIGSGVAYDTWTSYSHTLTP